MQLDLGMYIQCVQVGGGIVSGKSGMVLKPKYSEARPLTLHGSLALSDLL